MSIERDSWKVVIIFGIKYFMAFTIFIYLLKLGMTAFMSVKSGVFNFNFLGDFYSSVKTGFFWGLILGVGEWVMRKAKKFEENEKKEMNNIYQKIAPVLGTMTGFGTTKGLGTTVGNNIATGVGAVVTEATTSRANEKLNE
ncbi:hypothetical protein [uncultured Citrobacter sp.]|uniref:hypothetical protein n=1 Tax=uncultured Citrobacter sp. TaxID=200446 RepID=UPI00259A3AE9|nr:hypothetical protein [uncultured Citrobacter sp.]